MYILNYNTGFEGDKYETIAAAMAAVDPAYTQCNITIEQETGRTPSTYDNPNNYDDCDVYDLKTVAIMHWWNVAYDPDGDMDKPYTDFGGRGYYGHWDIL